MVLWFGEELESRVDVGPGDFLYIPPYVPHVPANASNTEWARGVVARTDPNEQESVELLPHLDGPGPSGALKAFRVGRCLGLGRCV